MNHSFPDFTKNVVIIAQVSCDYPGNGSYTGFGSVRTITVEGEAYFVGKDVAEILGYSNTRKALADHVDEEDKGVTKCDTPGGVQDLTVINESGLYSLILSSKMPNAKKFKRLVTFEVLPTIRSDIVTIIGIVEFFCVSFKKNF